MTDIDVLFLILAAWRVGHLFSIEHGPGDILVHCRKWLGVEVSENGFERPTTPLATLVKCQLCLSIWVAPLFLALFVLLPPFRVVTDILAISAGVCILSLWLGDK